MNAPMRPDYLELTLQEQKAARSSISDDARKRHEELAIAYEMLCLRGTDSSFAKSLIEFENI